ncbi:unnamed protein product [Symbiodinium sp. CCMP2592]|nr:unnamed protein product [Symbiodinium sp. CCMP2592]
MCRGHKSKETATQARPHCPEEDRCLTGPLAPTPAHSQKTRKETWEENLALRRQLADVHHQLRNLKENYTEELSFWRRRALELQLELTAERRTHGGDKSNGDLSQLEPMPPAAEDSQLRQAQQQVAKQLEELKASKEEAEARLAQSELLSEQLRDQASQQAVELLTREGLEPAETFAPNPYINAKSAEQQSYAHGWRMAVAETVITCSLPYLPEDADFQEGWNTSDCGLVLGFAALAAALGYGVHGPLIDRFGVVFGLSVALGGCSLGVALLATAETQAAFVLGSILVRFSYAAGWPAEMKALKLLVPEEYQGMAVSALGFASRGGAILGRGFFGVLLRSFTWRQIAWQAAQLLFVAGGIAVLVMRGLLTSASKAPEARSQSRAIRDILKEPSVWLVTGAFAFLCHVQHADDFMPLLFQGLTKSKSVVLSCVYPGARIFLPAACLPECNEASKACKDRGEHARRKPANWPSSQRSLANDTALLASSSRLASVAAT